MQANYDQYAKNVKAIATWLDHLADQATDIPEHRAGVFRDIILTILFSYVANDFKRQEILNYIAEAYNTKAPQLPTPPGEEIPF